MLGRHQPAAPSQPDHHINSTKVDESKFQLETGIIIAQMKSLDGSGTIYSNAWTSLLIVTYVLLKYAVIFFIFFLFSKSLAPLFAVMIFLASFTSLKKIVGHLLFPWLF